MAYDSKLYLRAHSVSGVFSTASELTISEISVLPLVLQGTPLRGLNCNIIVPSAISTPSLTLSLYEATISGGTYVRFRTYPGSITAAGEYNLRFHLDKGYTALKALYTLSGSTGVSVGNLDVRIGLDRGAWGNG